MMLLTLFILVTIIHTCAVITRMGLPPLPIVTQWVKTAWESIDLTIIIRALKKCSITNELDGTEDNILWQDDRDTPCANSDIEGDEMYDDMMTTDQMLEDDGDEEF